MPFRGSRTDSDGFSPVLGVGAWLCWVLSVLGGIVAVLGYLWGSVLFA